MVLLFLYRQASWLCCFLGKNFGESRITQILSERALGTTTTAAAAAEEAAAYKRLVQLFSRHQRKKKVFVIRHGMCTTPDCLRVRARMPSYFIFSPFGVIEPIYERGAVKTCTESFCRILRGMPASHKFIASVIIIL